VAQESQEESCTLGKQYVHDDFTEHSTSIYYCKKISSIKSKLTHRD